MKLKRSVLALAAASLGIYSSYGQTTLAVGDLQVLGATSDANDSFSFVLWKDIDANTVIRFMDHSFTNATTGVNGTENDMSLTFTSGLTAGTVIRVEDTSATLTNGGTFSGTKTGSLSGISVDGDQVFAYQGTAIGTGTSFSGRTLVYGFNVANTSWLTTGTASSNSSYIPDAISGIDTNFDSGSFDNVDYTGARTGMTTSAYRAAISNIANYTQSDTRFNLATDGFTINSSAILHWDGNGTTAGDGGAGTWDTTTQSRFKNGAAGTTFLRWVNSSTGNDHNAVFGGTAGTVSIASSGVTVSGLTFNVTGYTIESNILTLAGSTPTITVSNIADTASVNSAVAGSSGVIKAGSGTLELGGASTYTGNTVINNGILKLTTGNDRLPTGTVVSLGQASSTNLGTLDLNGRNQTIAGLASTAGDNAVLANTNVVTSSTAAILTIDGSTSNTYSAGTAANSGIISGAISLVKKGSGNQTLGGTNTYTGGTDVQAGTLTLGHASDTLANTGAVTVSGGTLALGANNDTVGAVSMSSGSITGSGTLTGSSYSFTGSGTVSAKLGGSANLSKSGAGTVTLEGVNSYSGTTGISGGILEISGTGSINNTSSITVTGGTFKYNSSTALTVATTVQSGGTIGGTGTVGALTIESGGFHSPGNSPGIQNVGNYDQNGTLVMEINGLTAGSQHDQVRVTGTVDITGAMLSLSSTGYTAVNNDLIFILLNDAADAITGTFAGLAQGQSVGMIGGKFFNISYNADFASGTFTGTAGGNDIALQAIPEPRAALLGAIGLLLILRRRR